MKKTDCAMSMDACGDFFVKLVAFWLKKCFFDIYQDECFF